MYIISFDPSDQSLSHVWLFATPWTAARQASLSMTKSWSLLKLMSIELVMPSNHLILCHPFLLPPSIFPSFRVLSNDSVLHVRWPKYWSFSFSIRTSNEFSGLISFKMDWLALLAVQGTLKGFVILTRSLNFIVFILYKWRGHLRFTEIKWLAEGYIIHKGQRNCDTQIQYAF